MTCGAATGRYPLPLQGYGKNKIIHMRTFAYDGYEFRIHPRAFVIHRPHTSSSAEAAHSRGAQFQRRSKTSSMYGHNAFLYKQVGRRYANARGTH